MTSPERLSLVAPCGIDCGICELYTCRSDARLFSALMLRGIPTDKIPCDGCRSIEGNCPVIKEECETYACVAEKKVEFCLMFAIPVHKITALLKKSRSFAA